MRKKRLLGLLLSLSMAYGAWAEGYTLVVSLTTGVQERYQLSEKPVVWFDTSSLEVRTATARTTIERSTVKDFTFEEGTSGIKGIQGTGNIQVAQLSDGNIAVSGLTAGSTVTVCDVAGRLLHTLTATADGQVTTRIAENQKGAFIININNKRTIKILKK